MNENVTCKQCGSVMRRTVRGEHNFAVQLLAIALCIVGVLLLFVVPVGTIIGIFIVLASFRMGYKRRKVWACGKCGYFFDRM